MKALTKLCIVLLISGRVLAQDTTTTVLSSHKRSLDDQSETSLTPSRTVPKEGHAVQAGDTLWTITQKYFGTPYEWPRVWSYNPDITNPNWIYPNTLVRLDGADHSISLPAKPQKSLLSKYFLPSNKTEVTLQQEGFLDRDALKDMGTLAGSTVDHMLLTYEDHVYVQFNDNARPVIGKEYTVFRRIKLREHDLNSTYPGTLVRVSGAIRVNRLDEKNKVAEATIIEALEPMERGFMVAPVVRKFIVLEPVPSDKAITAKVVAAVHPYQLLAEYQIVFLTAGSNQGVKVGNRFIVGRHGDEWRKELLGKETDMGTTLNKVTAQPKVYPEEVIAEARVVHVRPNTSAAIVTGTLKPVDLGDVAHTRVGY